MMVSWGTVEMPDGTTVSGPGEPSAVTKAIAAVLTDYHWRMFCDSWLSIGLVATLAQETGWAAKAIGARIGRVRRKYR